MFLLKVREQLTIFSMKTIIAFNLFLLCMLLAAHGEAQFILLTGNIINEKTGNSLQDVNILETNSGIGTITNLSGFFSLMLNPGNAQIVISHDGFQNYSKKLVLKNDTTLTVVLLPVLNPKAKSKETDHQKTAEKIAPAKKQ
jgi:hypothetical protein